MAEPLGLAEVRLALEEDRPTEDVTTRLLGLAGERPACAAFVAEGRFVVAGLPLVGHVYAVLDPGARVAVVCAEGGWAGPDAILARVQATAATLLAGLRSVPEARR